MTTMDSERLDGTTENVLAIIGLLLPALGIAIGIALMFNRPKSGAKVLAFSLAGFALTFALVTCIGVAMVGE